VPQGGGKNLVIILKSSALLKIWESQTRPKLSTILNNFRVWSHISPDWI